MKLFLIILTLALVACGKSNSGSSYSGPSNILRNWEGLYERPSFSTVEINQSENSYKYLLCNGSYYNSSTNQAPTYPNTSIPNYNTVYDPYYNPNQYNQDYGTGPIPYDSRDYYFPTSSATNYQNNYSSTNGRNQNTNRYTGVASAPKGFMIIRANNENEGTISFGELPYIGSSNPNCYLFSNQTLNYEVVGSRLIVCSRSNQNQCFEYSESF